MANLINEVTPVATAVLGWTGDVAETIVSTPLLLFTLGFFVIGGACGILGRMLSKN